MAKKKAKKRKRKYMQKVSVMTPEKALTKAVIQLVKKHGYIEPHGYSVRKGKRLKRRK